MTGTPFNAAEMRAGDGEDDKNAIAPPARADLRRRWEDLTADVASRGGWVCPPQACVLRDTLIERALSGDTQALAVLLAASASDLPVAIVKAFRDAAIRKMGAELRSAHPRMTESRAATILAAAGDRVARGRNLGEGKPFGAISVGEREKLVAEIKVVQAWSPPGTWPKRTRLIEILLTGI